MKRIGAITIALGACMAGYSIHALAQSSPRAVTAITTVLADGRTQLTLHNGSSLSLTAYAVESQESNTGANHFVEFIEDSTLASRFAPVSPGSDYSIIVARPNDHPVVTFYAALFQDGSAFGDGAWIKRLENRRLYAAQALASALADLRALAPAATSPRDLAEKLSAQEQTHISAFRAAGRGSAAPAQGTSSPIPGIDVSDRVEMFKTRYPIVLSSVTGGRCDGIASMIDCATAVNEAVRSSPQVQGYAQLIPPTN
jgi:hypothetical protein